jgi:protein ImuA
MVLPLHHDSPGRRARPEQALPGGLGLSLARGRVHEICGPARIALAALILAQAQGPALWVSPGWLPERLYPPGLAEFTDPGRLIFARAQRPEDLLWAMEEALRSGAAPLVLADLPSLPALTPVRRLHLAAEAGAEVAGHRGRLMPLGLILTPDEGGAQGVESRWHFAPAPSGSTLLEARQAWTLGRLRARMAPPASWHLQGGPDGRLQGAPS